MTDAQSALPLSEEQQKELAIDWFLAMWEEAMKRGVSHNIMASIALSCTLNKMVMAFGEPAVAELMAKVPEQVKAGSFTVQPQGEEPAGE